MDISCSLSLSYLLTAMIVSGTVPLHSLYLIECIEYLRQLQKRNINSLRKK